MAQRATGTFTVKLTPQAGDPSGEPTVGRMTINKQFQGDLEGISKGEMLAFMTSVQGSAGYVAMERVRGRLAEREGSFVLQHNGSMNRGSPSLTVHVVPDSATDELAGLVGTMNIIIADGRHSYEMEYTLPV